MEFIPQTQGGVWIVFGDVNKNLLQVSLGLRSEKKRSLH